jgi:hypothetical protein
LPWYRPNNRTADNPSVRVYALNSMHHASFIM